MAVHEINAEGKSMGRVATEVAIILRGKNSPSFSRNNPGTEKVHVSNASLVSLLPQKARNTKTVRYSGYPGGKKISSWEDIIKKHGHEKILRDMIEGMIPKNRLRPLIMKNLTISK